MRPLVALAASADPDRPLVEYYRRHEEIELRVPVPPESRAETALTGPPDSGTHKDGTDHL